MNSSHSGRRLARVFYRIVKRLGIIHKIAWVTCDNASNNTTMLQRFEVLINRSKHRVEHPPWLFNGYHIRCVVVLHTAHILIDFLYRCLAHVINLATQAFLSLCSTTAHFDPETPEGHEPDLWAEVRDVIGLVRAIGVKVPIVTNCQLMNWCLHCSQARSSAKRKEKFLQLQRDAGSSSPRNMKIDMPVRWSSTYSMLVRGRELSEVCYFEYSLFFATAHSLIADRR